MNVTWSSPVEENGVITKYTLTYRHNFGGVTNSTEVSTNSQTFEYNFDVLGGVKYTVSVYAETIKPGPKEEQVESVPVYSKRKMISAVWLNNFEDKRFVIPQF